MKEIAALDVLHYDVEMGFVLECGFHLDDEVAAIFYHEIAL